ncbi:MAG: hypothetical protein QXN16_02945 [Candidatus Micrarchaeaceae archaeon]
MTTQKEKQRNEKYIASSKKVLLSLLIAIIIGFGLGYLLYPVMGYFTFLFILILIIFIIINSSIAVDIAFAVGLIVGIFICLFFIPSSSVAPSPSYYQGIVQGIGSGPHNNYIQFTSGTTLYGNVTHISNLSIGATCTLLLNQSYTTFFINGTCKR